MKIIVNTTNLNHGGILQGALSFIEEAKLITHHSYHVFLASTLSEHIDKSSFPDNFQFYEFRYSPRSVPYGLKVIRKLERFEKRISPDCVLSLSGPTYWNPRVLHVMGFARPHYIYKEYFNNIKYSIVEYISFVFKSRLHRFLFKKNADFFLTQTNDVAERLSHFLQIDKSKIFTIGNTYHPVFDIPVKELSLLPPNTNREFRMITITAFYKHKNLEIINKVIPYLIDANIKFKFVLTLPSEIFYKKFGHLSEYVINVGQVSINSCPYLYANCDALFLPTLLECFSASYPEAMKMSKPILTSDYSFAKDICKDAALYFNPLNPSDIAEKIVELFGNINLQRDLIENGKKRLTSFESPTSRAEKYIRICENIQQYRGD